MADYYNSNFHEQSYDQNLGQWSGGSGTRQNQGQGSRGGRPQNLSYTSRGGQVQAKGGRGGPPKKGGQGPPPTNSGNESAPRPRTNARTEPARRPRIVGKFQMPVPKHLSSTQSVEKNDPLDKDCFAPKVGMEFRPDPGEEHVYSSAYGLNALISESYDRIVATSRTFGRRISPSAYSYYITVLAWARMLDAAAKCGRYTSYDERDFIHRVSDAGYIVPEPLSLYFSGFGSTTTPGGTLLLYGLVPFEYVESANLNGWFGRFNAQTHFLYENYPSLGLAARRVQVEQLQVLGNWALPADVTPLPVGEHQPGNPTTNIVGYGPITLLRPEALNTVANCEITADNFPTINAQFPLNQTLMNVVQVELLNTKAFKLTPISTEKVGSRAQVVYQECSPDTIYTPASITCQYQTTEITRGIEKMNYRLVASANVFLYRFVRRRLTDRRGGAHYTWSAYEWEDFTNVPQTWIDTANRLRRDEPELIQLHKFQTTAYQQSAKIKRLYDALTRH